MIIQIFFFDIVANMLGFIHKKVLLQKISFEIIW